jgi:drug/metabolite transporter (DMT)-like permease
LSDLTGYFAALGTALLFTATSVQFTLAGQRVGSLVLNRVRLVFAVAWLLIAHLISSFIGLDGGEGFLPLLQAGPERWFWLGLSGIVGLVIGDAFLFQAFLWVGPRLTMLMMSTVPVQTTLIAWLFLGERLRPLQLAAILLTVGGIAWVVNDGRKRLKSIANGNQAPIGAAAPVASTAIAHQAHLQTGAAAASKDFTRGILFGLGASIGQASGLVLAKVGAVGGFPPLTGTLIRMLAAVVFMWAITLLQRQAWHTLKSVRHDRRALLLITSGSLTGPFLGVTLSLLAVQLAPVGIASTLMALTPVLLLPVSYLVFGERFGWQAWAGTLTALAGVTLLFMV